MGAAGGEGEGEWRGRGRRGVTVYLPEPNEQQRERRNGKGERGWRGGDEGRLCHAPALDNDMACLPLSASCLPLLPTPRPTPQPP